MAKKYNATFWHEGHVIGSGYGSSRGVALQNGARQIQAHTSNNCTLENVRITIAEVGANRERPVISTAKVNA